MLCTRLPPNCSRTEGNFRYEFYYCLGKLSKFWYDFSSLIQGVSKIVPRLCGYYGGAVDSSISVLHSCICPEGGGWYLTIFGYLNCVANLSTPCIPSHKNGSKLYPVAQKFSKIHCFQRTLSSVLLYDTMWHNFLINCHTRSQNCH